MKNKGNYNAVDGFLSALLLWATVIMAAIVLLWSTSPTPVNANIPAMEYETQSMVCQVGVNQKLTIDALRFTREGDSLHIRHPSANIVIQDPQRVCVVVSE